MFTFDERRHLYFLDGKALTGTTTILGVINKPFLVPWAANEAVGYIRETAKCDDGIYKVDDDLLEKARKAYARKKDKSADIGTAVHKAVEEWIKIEKDPELDEAGMKMFENFKQWALENKVKFLESEKRVYSKKYWYA